jgi:hypothetical protein
MVQKEARLQAIICAGRIAAAVGKAAPSGQLNQPGVRGAPVALAS